MQMRGFIFHTSSRRNPQGFNTVIQPLFLLKPLSYLLQGSYELMNTYYEYYFEMYYYIVSIPTERSYTHYEINML